MPDPAGEVRRRVRERERGERAAQLEMRQVGTDGAAGGVALRFSVFRAGFQSARDPKYTVIPQKERLRARESG
jgi:hypothetical protein